MRSIRPLSHFDTARRDHESDRLADKRKRLPGRSARREPEHEPDHQILRDQDRQHEVCLLVGEPSEVDQPLYRDRTRRDVDRRREHERAEAEAECSDAHDQAETCVHKQVDRTTYQRVPPAAEEPSERELQTEEEEQEHEPDLGHEVGHLRGTDQAERPWLVRPKQQPRKQIGGNRRQSKPACEEPQRCE
jgi:hypothetical protein